MKTVIGIDVGGSTTKIVGFREAGDGTRELITPQLVRANDPITSTYGAFGKFTDENNLKISDITRVMMTGVGSSHVKRNLYGLDCVRVEEFESIGVGGLYLSGLDEALGNNEAHYIHAYTSPERSKPHNAVPITVENLEYSGMMKFTP